MKLRKRTALAAIGLMAAQVAAARAAPPPLDTSPSAAEVDAQYAAALGAMKRPAASGVLVTEIEPSSPSGGAGLRAGDIIVKLAGQDVRDLKTLRQRVADLLAAAVAEGVGNPVELVVRREAAPQKNKQDAAPTQTVTLKVPREPLGIRAIEVEAGAPARLNPPPSPRGSIVLAWNELRQLQNNGGDLGQATYFRTNDWQENWLGWQIRAVEPVADDALSGKVEVTRIEPQDGTQAISATEAITFRLRTGDYSTAPAFVLESAEVTTKSAGGPVVTTTAVRAGALLRTQAENKYANKVEGPFKHERPCPLAALVPAAVPVVAAAMPQQKDAVLSLYLMSARDFVPRPGYAIVAKGKQQLPKEAEPLYKITTTRPKAAPAPAEAWRVDLMHCGTTIETYWLSDNRRLLRTDSYSGTDLISRRVLDETEARVPVAPKSK